MVQLQNLPRGTIKLAELAIPYIIEQSVDLLEALFGPALEVVSSSLRGCLIAAPSHRFIVADYANIEGRVTAWLAGESWKLHAFRDFDNGSGPDLYKLAYSRSFGIPVADVTDDQRQVGKVMELALGFQGGTGALQAMARNYGMSIAAGEAEKLKEAWRGVHPAVVALWRSMESAVFRAVASPGSIETAAAGRIKFHVKGGFLWMILPSGRPLAYASPSIVRREMPWGAQKDVVIYHGIDSHNRQWSEQTGYGGLWTENAVQAIARDIMAAAMLRLEAAGYPLVCSVHDELIAEVPEGTGSLAEYEDMMVITPEWACGCPVAAKGWAGTRYRKG